MRSTHSLTQLRLLLRAGLCIVVLTASSFAQGKSAAVDPELKLVVALFRHGVRAPLPHFDDKTAKEHSKDIWPNLSDWQVMDDGTKPGTWGYLTKHGQTLATELGKYYGNYYGDKWTPQFRVYLWVDGEDQRTRETGKALEKGLSQTGAYVIRESLSDGAIDPLFHPFRRGCGKPDGEKLKKFAAEIDEGWLMWAMTTYDFDFRQLYDLLNCFNKDDCASPLIWVVDKANWCVTPQKGNCESPLSWRGRFSYASSASETFLLEYANNMKVSWDKVDPPNSQAHSKLRDMLRLHEFYFDKTDRFLHDNKQGEHYLASIEGSNLIREILDQIKLKVRETPDGNCARGALFKRDFVGFVGHDTNLASVGALLELGWQFENPNLPPDTRGLPANDALPAGALVFELRLRNGNYFVRVEYVAQSLSQMRKGSSNQAFRIAVDGPNCVQKNPCEIPLATFKQLVEKRIQREFLSYCNGQMPPQQKCGLTPSRRTKK